MFWKLLQYPYLLKLLDLVQRFLSSLKFQKSDVLNAYLDTVVTCVNQSYANVVG